jgi:hemoglobin
MLLRLLVIATVVFSISACSTNDKKKSADEGAATEDTAAADNPEGGDKAAAKSDDGLTDEPLGDEAKADAKGGKDEVSDAGMTSQPVQKSLFERVGGMKALEAFADKFVDAVAKHPPLQGNANIVNAMKADQSRHKKLLAEFFCEQSGGPCKYSGRDLKTVHAPLKMTAAEWNSIRGLFIRTLKDLGVQKQERSELAIIAVKQKKNIVSQ